MKTINIADVIDVTGKGVRYKDSSDPENTVLFDECRKNWVEHINQGGFTDCRGNPARITFEQSRCVGERDMTAKPPYILLYADEKLKIEMKSAIFIRQTRAQRDFLTALYEVGKVNTFDLT